MEESFSIQDKKETPHEMSFNNSQSNPINLETNESMALSFSQSSANTALFPVLDTENSIVSSIQCIETGQSEEEEVYENKISKAKVRHVSNLDDPYMEENEEIDIIEEKLDKESDRASPSQLEEIENEEHKLEEKNKVKAGNIEKTYKQIDIISKHICIKSDKLRNKELLLENTNSSINDLQFLTNKQNEKIKHIDSMITSMNIYLEQYLASKDKNINNLNDYLSEIKIKSGNVIEKIDFTKEKIKLYKQFNSKNIYQTSPQNPHPSHNKKVSFHMSETNDLDFPFENPSEFEPGNSNYNASSKMPEISISQYAIVTPRSIMKTPTKTPMDSLLHSEVNSQYEIEVGSEKNSNRSRSNSAKSWNSEGKKHKNYVKYERYSPEIKVRKHASTPRNMSQSSFNDIYDNLISGSYSRHARSENISFDASERPSSPYDSPSILYKKKPKLLNTRNEIKPQIKLNPQIFQESSWNTSQFLLCLLIFILGYILYLNLQRTSILI